MNLPYYAKRKKRTTIEKDERKRELCDTNVIKVTASQTHYPNRIMLNIKEREPQ